MIKELDALIRKNAPLEGVLKTWIPHLQFYKPLGTVAAVKSSPVLKYLKVNGKKTGHTEYDLKQCTEIMEPKGCYIGKMYLDDLCMDFSSMLLLDAVMGNGDRFPGGNVHFRALSDKVEKKGKSTYVYPISRLLALDNGAMFKENDILKYLKEFRVCRFVKEHLNRLSLVDPRALFLDAREQVLFKKNLKKVFGYTKKCDFF